MVTVLSSLPQKPLLMGELGIEIWASWGGSVRRRGERVLVKDTRSIQKPYGTYGKGLLTMIANYEKYIPKYPRSLDQETSRIPKCRRTNHEYMLAGAVKGIQYWDQE